MTRHNIPLGRIMGIPIGLDYSWFLIFGLLTWMLASNYYPAEFSNWSALLYWSMGAFTTIMLFVSVLLHELGHAAVALRYGIPVGSITLFLFGGVAQIKTEPPSAISEFWIAIAGPLVSLALAAIFYLAQQLATGFEPLLGLVTYLAYINLALVVFNLIPGFPLDGGRVLRAIVWRITGSMSRSTLIAATVGRFFAFIFIIVGVFQMFAGNFGGGLWIAFIGWFLDNAANAQILQVRSQGVFEGHTVAQAMDTSCTTITGDVKLQELVDEHILNSGQRWFLVKQEDAFAGLITLHQINKVPRAEWGTTAVAQIMLPIEQLKHIDPDARLWDALQEMDRDGVNQLPVIRDQRVMGMLSRENVITYLRSIQELGIKPAIKMKSQAIKRDHLEASQCYSWLSDGKEKL